MLTEADIEMIQETRKEVYKNRTYTITLVVESPPKRDPITGEPIPQKPEIHECEAIVTEISSVSDVDRHVVDGIELRKDDIKIDIDYGELPFKEYEPKLLIYRNKDYEVIATAHKGLGKLNRIECLGRIVS